jgi:acyl-homoserine-lactone acylase
MELAFANRVHAAELVLPKLIDACISTPAPDLAAACSALAAWDRRSDLDSRGAVLFREFWMRADRLPGKWSVPFDPADPVNTPHTPNAAGMPALLQALREADSHVRSHGLAADARLGDLQGEVRNGRRHPIHGGIGNQDGSYNSLRMATALTPQGYTGVEWGTSYVQVVTFDQQGPVAHGMLVYGQSTDPESPWYDDQLAPYARKEWARLPFSEQEIRRSAGYATLRLSE